MTVSGEIIMPEPEPASESTVNEIQGEDKPLLSFPETMSAGVSSYWDSIILTLAVIGGTIAVYFIIRFFIGKSGLIKFR